MKAHEMVARVQDLPSISVPALRLVTLLGDSQAGIEDAVQVIKQDAALTAKLLRVCNSPCLALQEPVGSVNQAVLLLGQKRVYNMVMAMSLREPLDVALPAYAMQARDLWRHSLVAAIAAEMVVDQGINIEVDSSTAFTVGLLHDIGKLITNQFLTEQSLIWMKRLTDRGQSSVEAEKNVLGTDHAEVGAALACVWHLPDFIVEGIGLHHSPPPGLKLSALAYFANRVAHEWEGPGEGHEPSATEREFQIFEELGFAGDRSSLIDRISGASVEMEEVLASG